MAEKRNGSKSIKALTVLSAFLITLDVVVGGYFAAKALKKNNTEETSSVEETSEINIANSDEVMINIDENETSIVNKLNEEQKKEFV